MHKWYWVQYFNWKKNQLQQQKIEAKIKITFFFTFIGKKKKGSNS